MHLTIRVLVAVVALSCASTPVHAYLKPDASELMALPKFCWGRYKPELKQPTYNIPKKTCGPLTNHYCDALINYVRATRPGAKHPHRIIALSVREIEYTRKGISKFPACPIRKHVEQTYARARSAQALFNARVRSQP